MVARTLLHVTTDIYTSPVLLLTSRLHFTTPFSKILAVCRGNYHVFLHRNKLWCLSLKAMISILNILLPYSDLQSS